MTPGFTGRSLLAMPNLADLLTNSASARPEWTAIKLDAGATIVPMNPLLKEREVAFYLRDSGVKILAPPSRSAAR
jgi:acyl-CoA synthetase (AMP-forming)/AMP-acid ligase II